MPSAETETDEDASEETEPVDEARNALLEVVTAELGDALVDTHLIPGRDLWLRVSNEAWDHTADYLRNRQRFRFFNWLSAIDWMESPYGRSLDSAVDNEVGSDAEDAAASEPAPDETGSDETGSDETGSDEDVEPSGAGSAAGGETRFQVLGRVYNLSTRLGVTVKADVDDEVAIGTWTNHFPGADWHEREAWEMFGISFRGHPGLRNLYLPGDFEGHPLRKDFPLLARMVKPWPGIIDVEPMPEVSDANDKPSTTNPEAK